MTRTLLMALLVACSASLCTATTIFQPDSATASSEFSGNYLIGFTIDGTGMPPGFGPNDPHAPYARGNHWTTQANQVPGASASFQFNSDTTIGTFYMWNHQSNGGLASNPNYEVTEFDLILRDAGGVALLTLNGLQAAGETPTAQSYSFVPVDGVRSVDFVVQSNQGLGVQGTNYTGLAEVAFSAAGIPEPAGLLLMASVVSVTMACRLRVG